MKTLPLLVCAGALALSGCASLSDKDRAVLERQRVPARLQDRMEDGRSLALEEVIELSRRGVPAETIVRYMRGTTRVYRLDSTDVTRLQKAGVKPPVIDYMLATPTRNAQRYVDPWWGGWGYGGWWGYQPWWGYGPGYYGPGYWASPVIVVRGGRGRH